MSLFGAVVRTVVNVATLPVAVAKDAVYVMEDAASGQPLGGRTREAIETIKEEANDDYPKRPQA